MAEEVEAMTGITDEIRRAGWDAFKAAIEGGYDSPQVYAQTLEAIIAAFTAGRTVVDLPPRDEVNSHERHGTWIIDGDLEVSFEAFLHWSDNSPTIEVGHERGGTEEWGTDALRAYCLAGLAACDFADRLAADQSSGVAGGGAQ